ncbi:hypothetical protein PSH57_21595 [Pseudomonas hefeiensis]|uniref:Uncharacterized protein n=1 Tax=Pseudomonas hefeiensis TaxID=2738125 RepID=A0ABY9GIQ3_9PSED|nr:hypothetical protein [Pseudomonas sp. FP205]WLH15537.1 hypothetical protein PSH57_21595 [Pseudomonas sp. FP205]
MSSGHRALPDFPRSGGH